MRRYLKPLGGLALFALLCTFPEASRDAAAQALAAWAHGVAPSLLPFMIALPALSCDEACEVYRVTLGRLLPRVGIPPELAGALLTGLVSGSPAGAAAVAQLAARTPLDKNAALRCAWIGSGASMGFLMSTVPTVMLNRPELGRVLVCAQLLGQVSMAFLMRRISPLRGKTHASPISQSSEKNAFRGAVWSVMTIAAYMVFFRVMAEIAASFLGTWANAPICAALELAGGCEAVASLSLPMPLKTALLSAVAGFGGVSGCMQCSGFLVPLGIPLKTYVPGKLIQAALTGGFAFALTALTEPQHRPFAPDAGLFSACAACVLLVTLAAFCFVKRRKDRGALSE